MAAKDQFHVTVVTPERSVLDTDARFVAFPAHDGQIGILPHRAPLLVRVGIGELRAETASGEERFFVDGGFAQMVGNKLTVLTEEARRPEEIDRGAAEAALGEARAMEIRGEGGYERRHAALERARQQLRIAP